MLGARRVLEGARRRAVEVRASLGRACQEDEPGVLRRRGRAGRRRGALRPAPPSRRARGRRALPCGTRGTSRGALRRARASRRRRAALRRAGVAPSGTHLARRERARVEVEPAHAQRVVLEVVVRRDVRRRSDDRVDGARRDRAQARGVVERDVRGGDFGRHEALEVCDAIRELLGLAHEEARRVSRSEPPRGRRRGRVGRPPAHLDEDRAEDERERVARTGAADLGRRSPSGSSRARARREGRRARRPREGSDAWLRAPLAPLVGERRDGAGAGGDRVAVARTDPRGLEAREPLGKRVESVPAARRPAIIASTSTVPEPQNGSRTSGIAARRARADEARGGRRVHARRVRVKAVHVRSIGVVLVGSRRAAASGAGAYVERLGELRGDPRVARGLHGAADVGERTPLLHLAAQGGRWTFPAAA